MRALRRLGSLRTAGAIALLSRSLVSDVAHAEVDALMLAFRNSDPDRHLRRLLFGVERLDVGKLKQLQAVEPSLGVLQQTPSIEIARLEGELARDDARTDGLIALNVYRT